MKRNIRILTVVTATGLSIFTTNLFAQSGHPSSVEGLPFSGTSITAGHQLRQSGFLQSMSRDEMEAEDREGAADEAANDRSFSLTPEYGAFTAPQLEGDTYTLPAYANFKLTDRVGLSFNVPLQYSQYRSPGGKLEVWNANVTVGLPIKIIPKSKDSPFSWTVTPHLGGGAYFADDGADSYTYVGHGGVTSMLGFQNQHIAISLANQITFYETLDREGSYDFTPDISQKIWKNGLKVSVPIGQQWVADAYAIHTEFLETAFLERYFTLGASVGYHLSNMKKGSYVKLGTYTELAHNFQSIHFQFGTGWKF